MSKSDLIRIGILAILTVIMTLVMVYLLTLASLDIKKNNEHVEPTELVISPMELVV